MHSKVNTTTLAPDESRFDGLLLVAHGSRVESSNEEIASLASRLQARFADTGQLSPTAPVLHAFLELASPSIENSIDQCADLGVTALGVIPYFLAAGRHVRDDIPGEITAGRQRHPELQITLLSYVGQSDGMVDLLIGLTSD